MTVGTQLPFDRMIKAVDKWAGKHGHIEVLAQVGEGHFAPIHIAYQRTLSPDEFSDAVARCDVIVAHAGIGTILLALEHAKPIIVMPRRVKYGEQRTDHQVATASRFRDLGLVHVADDEEQLIATLDTFGNLSSVREFRREASPELLEFVRQFVTAPAKGARRG